MPTKRYLVILLGPRDRFLGVYGAYDEEDKADEAAESLHELCLANAEGRLPLKERLKLAPYYFAQAGLVHEPRVVDICTEARGPRSS